MPKVSIIILNFNGIKDTIECINSVKKISYQNYNIVLVDNNSNLNDRAVIKSKYSKDKKIHIIFNDKNLGFSGGNNSGMDYILKEGISKYIFLLNNDTIVDSEFLTSIVNKAEKSKNVSTVSPLILNYKDKNIIDNTGVSFFKSGFPLSINHNKDINFINNNYPSKLFCAQGAAMLISVKALSKIKIKNEYFDNEFFLYNEETDLGFRFLHQGFVPYYDSKSIVYHKGYGSKSPLVYYYTLRNYIFVVIKNYPLKYLIKYSIFILIMHFLLSLLYLKRSGLKFIPIIIKVYIDIFRLLPNMVYKRNIILSKSVMDSNVLYKYLENKIFPIDYLYIIKH